MAEKRDIKRHKKRISIRFGVDELNRVAFTEDISISGMGSDFSTFIVAKIFFNAI